MYCKFFISFIFQIYDNFIEFFDNNSLDRLLLFRKLMNDNNMNVDDIKSRAQFLGVK